MNRKNFLHLSGLVLAATVENRANAAPLFSSFPPATPGTPLLPLAADAKEAGFLPDRLDSARQAVRDAVEKNGVPGAVLLIGRKGKIAVREAWGYAGLRPEKRTVAVDTLFDLASLTKCVATASSVMLLIEEGKVGLDDTAVTYLPAFKNAGDPKDKITVRHLLTHAGGLVAGGAYGGKTLGLVQMLGDIAASKQKAPPGTTFIYSDFSAVSLQGVVEAVTGQTLDAFAQTRIYGPLGMTDTGFKPGVVYADRCAATTSGDDTPQTRGLVHDPIARALGGVAGNAGLFSTADDLARFCQMLLNGGIYDRVRIFQPETVQLMTTKQSPFEGRDRALGWDMKSPYSIQGNLPDGSWGHTGFTGTSLWCDPKTGVFIILLTNAVHATPSASGVVIPLRRRVSSLAAYALPELNAPAPFEPAPAVVSGNVLTGLDVLAGENFARLRSRKGVGVVCNHTALDKQGRHIADLLTQSGANVPVKTFFGPEHGIRGEVDASVGDSRDSKTGLPVVSLYNLQLPKEQRYRPTPEQLAGIDTLIYDIQDIGARYYTYIATLGYCMEAAAKNKVKIIVLDRPNPLGGNLVEGPLLDAAFTGNFTGYHNAPITHGMTVGELAQLFNKERNIGADLEVVPLQNWNRALLFDQTGLQWVNPSPNIRNVREAALYPGVGFLEVLPLSVGRGTESPFEIFGAPWITAPELLAANLTARNLPGVSFAPAHFTPTASKFAKTDCGGVHITLLDRTVYRPSEMGIHLADALIRLYPQTLTPPNVQLMARMIGTKAVCDALSRGVAPETIIAGWAGDVAQWKKRRAPFLLYR